MNLCAYSSVTDCVYVAIADCIFEYPMKKIENNRSSFPSSIEFSSDFPVLSETLFPFPQFLRMWKVSVYSQKCNESPDDSILNTINAIKISLLGDEQVLLVGTELGIVLVYFIARQDIISGAHEGPIVFYLDHNTKLKSLWERYVGRNSLPLSNYDNSIWGIASAKNRFLLAISCNAHFIVIFDLKRQDSMSKDQSSIILPNEAVIQRIPLPPHDHNIPSLEFSPDERTLASCSIDGSVFIWSIRYHADQSYDISQSQVISNINITSPRPYLWTATFVDLNSLPQVDNFEDLILCFLEHCENAFSLCATADNFNCNLFKPLLCSIKKLFFEANSYSQISADKLSKKHYSIISDLKKRLSVLISSVETDLSIGVEKMRFCIDNLENDVSRPILTIAAYFLRTITMGLILQIILWISALLILRSELGIYIYMIILRNKIPLIIAHLF